MDSGCTAGWTQVALEVGLEVALQVGWKMINLSVRDRAGQSGSRERGPDGKVKSQGILGATPRGDQKDPMISHHVVIYCHAYIFS